MSEKTRQKKDHHRKDKENQAMKEASLPRKQQASIRFGEQKSLPLMTAGVAANEEISQLEEQKNG